MLNKKTLIHLEPIRIFCFGCSFTQYLWATWAEIIGYEFNKAEFYNFGKSGAGNQYIFNMLMQADSVYNFTHEDLVMVQWTNVSREDRYLHAGHDGLHDTETKHGAWSTPGNIYTQGFYDEKWLKMYFSEYGAMVRDLAFIKAAYQILKHKSQWHFLQMNNLVMYSNQWDEPKKITDGVTRGFGDKSRIEHLKDVYSDAIASLSNSFYDVLYNNNWNQKFESDRRLVNKNFQDGHPHPLEHYDYLKRTFKHDWSARTNKGVSDLQKRWIKLMNNASHNKKKFSIYQEEKRWTDMAYYELRLRKTLDLDFRLHR